VALGVLIDTFLVRPALVPGLTLWVGPKAGWPGRRWDKEERAA
jgi:RND superfamily putative drug exporter